MYSANVYDQYRRTKVETLTPGKLLLMLYDGALNNIKQAREAIAARDIARAHQHIIKTQDIVVELMATLNMDYPISTSLYRLYDYLHNRLVESNINKDPAILDEVEAMMDELRQTWDEAIKSLGRNRVFQANHYQALNVSS
ncbi:MAG: flagellar export chaperone FliS [Syntrophomonadaceae bacterium]